MSYTDTTEFQSTRLAGSRDEGVGVLLDGSGISIHAARREPRLRGEAVAQRELHISIHAARREPRLRSTSASRILSYFNPRGSQGAATYEVICKLQDKLFQSTRLAGSRDVASTVEGMKTWLISIHAARREPRLESVRFLLCFSNFNPRGSQGAATKTGKPVMADVTVFQSTRLAGSRDRIPRGR